MGVTVAVVSVAVKDLRVRVAMGLHASSQSVNLHPRWTTLVRVGRVTRHRATDTPA